MTDVFIKTEFIKLDQLLKFEGIAQTGGHAKELINDGFVKVNDEVCYARGKKIYPNDIVKVENEVLLIKEQNNS